MNSTKRVSLWAASLEIGGYPELLSNLARKHGLKIHVNTRGRYVNREDLEHLRRLVGEWLSRPRMSREISPSERMATPPGRRRGKASSGVIGEGS
jgi:hypothetical protein